MSLTSAALPDNSTEPSRPHRLMRMPLSPEQEIRCERLEKGEPDPRAAALIRQQAREDRSTSGIVSVAPMRSFGKSRPQR